MEKPTKWNFETQGPVATVKKEVAAMKEPTGKVKEGEVVPIPVATVVRDALAAMIDSINLKPDHPDPTKTYSVSVKCDGQGDDTFISGRFEVARIVVGK